MKIMTINIFQGDQKKKVKEQEQEIATLKDEINEKVHNINLQYYSLASFDIKNPTLKILCISEVIVKN